MRDAGEGGWSLAPFSGRGPTADGRIKPDLCAPGYRITAPKAGTADRYVPLNGTSMAAPFVAGTAALLLSANPYLSAEEVKAILYRTAEDWGPLGKDSDYGWGVINPYRALQNVLWLAGPAPAGPKHQVNRGTLKQGEDALIPITVTEPGAPLAVTLLLPDAPDSKYDFDLYLFDGAGVEVARSMSTGRFEAIHTHVAKAGTYTAKVHAFVGTGAYTLDVSYR
jgi:serine protease AprX